MPVTVKTARAAFIRAARAFGMTPRGWDRIIGAELLEESRRAMRSVLFCKRADPADIETIRAFVAQSEGAD